MKKISVVALMALFSVSMVSVSFAEGENSVTGFFRRLFNAPVKAVKETGSMTSNVLQNTGEKVVSKTGENTEAIVKGDVAKTTNLVTDNVTGVAETTGQAVSETVQIPVKSADEAKS